MDELNTVTDGETQIDLLRDGEPIGGTRYRGQLEEGEQAYNKLIHA